jgi:hypothetical protein
MHPGGCPVAFGGDAQSYHYLGQEIGGDNFIPFRTCTQKILEDSIVSGYHLNMLLDMDTERLKDS